MSAYTDSLFLKLVEYTETPNKFPEAEAKLLRQECSGHATQLIERNARVDEYLKGDDVAPNGEVFSFRAECFPDVVDFIRDSARTHHRMVYAIYGDTQFPDVEVEFQSSHGLADARRIMRGIDDSHVMLETMKAQPLHRNPLKRTYGDPEDDDVISSDS